VCFVHSVGEQRPEVGTAGGHDGAVHREMSVLDPNDGIAQLPVLAQVVQNVARLKIHADSAARCRHRIGLHAMADPEILKREKAVL